MTPTDAELSAFEAEAKAKVFEAEAAELDKRLRMLCHDYTMLFLRHPHVDGLPSTEQWERAKLLQAIRVHPWRKELAALADTFEREAFGEDKQDWLLRMWVERFPAILEFCKWDVQCVARCLVNTVPAPYRLRCPGYPAAGDPDAFGAAAMAVATRIRGEVGDSKKWRDLDAKLIALRTLEAMGDKGARHLRFFRGPDD